MTCHFHWLYRKGPQELRGVSRGISLCGQTNVPRAELTAFRDDADCPRCLELYRADVTQEHASRPAPQVPS